jgi:hypothetical protein
MAKAVIQTTVRLNPEDYESIRQAAQRDGLSIGAWLELAAREKLGRDDKKEGAGGAQ